MNLKAARVNCGYTMKEAAHLIGVNPDTLGRWERGETFPTVPQIKRIETVYKISYNEINFLCNENTV